MEKKTVLYDIHVRAGGKIVSFGGYLLPVQYKTGILQEHAAVRNAAGLFDVSHMGEITVRGKDALQNLNYLLTNDFSDMRDGRIRYSPMCYAEGGVVDDLLVYKCGENRYMLCVNASNKDKDYAWIQKNLFGDVRAEDISESVCQIALQGPRATDILQKCMEQKYIPQKYYTFIGNAFLQGIPCILSRTGYTGENGYEIYAENVYAKILWNILMEAGEAYALLPCGLGSRDTLRLEASMPLYGHEITRDITPMEAGLGMFVKMGKPDFIGKKALAFPPKRERIGLRLIDRGIAREGAKVFASGEEVGYVTSGTSSPTLHYSIAMALVDTNRRGGLTVEVRGKCLAAEETTMPFYKRQ